MFFTYLPESQILKKCLFIQTNSFIIFTYPGFRASGLARRLLSHNIIIYIQQMTHFKMRFLLQDYFIYDNEMSLILHLIILPITDPFMIISILQSKCWHHMYDSSRMSHDRKCTIGLIAIDCIGGLVGLWCLMPLSTIFQLYRELVLLVEETRVPGEKN